MSGALILVIVSAHLLQRDANLFYFAANWFRDLQIVPEPKPAIFREKTMGLRAKNVDLQAIPWVTGKSHGFTGKSHGIRDLDQGFQIIAHGSCFFASGIESPTMGFVSVQMGIGSVQMGKIDHGRIFLLFNILIGVCANGNWVCADCFCFCANGIESEPMVFVSSLTVSCLRPWTLFLR
jgi:hypothetical protein